jgi:hypothetical protein
VSHPTHEIPAKALVAAAVVVICGMALLLMDKSGSSSGNRAPAESKVVPGTGQARKHFTVGYDSGQGFAEADMPSSPGRTAAGADGPDQAQAVNTNDPAVVEFRAKLDNINTIRKFPDRKEALLQYGRELARNNLAAGFALLKALSRDVPGFSQSDLRTICQGFFEAASQINMNYALAMAMQFPSGFHRVALGTVMKEWAKSDLNSAFAYVYNLPAEFAHHGIESVFSVWGEKDPGAALTEALKFRTVDSGRLYRAAISSVIDGWAGVDPQGAWAFVTNPDNGWKDVIYGNQYILGIIASRWAEKDLDGALAAIRGLTGRATASGTSGEGDRPYQHMVEMLAMRLMDTDPEKAGKLFDREQWLAANPWLASRNISRLIDQGSVTEAAEWMLKIPNKQRAFDCARQLAASRTTSDYDMVFKWATMIQDDYIKAGALSNVASQQAQHDINRPIDWIYDLPDGYAKDRSVAGYALGKIRQTRDRQLEGELRKLMGQPQIDMSIVTAIITRSKVPQQQKDELMNLAEGRRPVQPLVIQ